VIGDPIPEPIGPTILITPPFPVGPTILISEPSEPTEGVDGPPAPYHAGIMESLPARESPNDKTSGTLTDVNGETTLGHVLSGKRPQDTDLKTPFRQYVSVQDHAEGHAAALIRDLARDQGLGKATLYINNSEGPCAGPRGCDAVLRDILPAGFKLTVYYPAGRKEYEGTGIGLK
jgi:hypothetical protein